MSENEQMRMAFEGNSTWDGRSLSFYRVADGYGEHALQVAWSNFRRGYMAALSVQLPVAKPLRLPAGWEIEIKPDGLSLSFVAPGRRTFGWVDRGSAANSLLWDLIEESLKREPARKCGAQRSTGADTPQECDWPMCGCDPHADKVIAALQECGHLLPDPKSRSMNVIGFRARVKSTSDWQYVFDRSPDSFELRECEIESICALPNSRGIDS